MGREQGFARLVRHERVLRHLVWANASASVTYSAVVCPLRNYSPGSPLAGCGWARARDGRKDHKFCRMGARCSSLHVSRFLLCFYHPTHAQQSGLATAEPCPNLCLASSLCVLFHFLTTERPSLRRLRLTSPPLRARVDTTAKLSDSMAR